MNCAAERCSAPKTANGMAKHKLLKATTLSRPGALAMSVFAAHSAISKSTMLALPMENAVRENSNNARRIEKGMGVTQGSCARARFPKPIGKRLYYEQLYQDFVML